MKRLIEKIKAEIEYVRVDINIALVILSAPLFYALFYGSIYMNKFEESVPIAVWDNDRSELTRNIINDLQKHQSLSVDYAANSYEEAKRLLASSEAYAVIRFEKGFEKKLKSTKQTDVGLYINTARFLVANDINRAVNETLAKYRYGIRLKYLESGGMNRGQALGGVEPVRADIRPMFNALESYGDFLIPGVLILILQQTLLIGLAESVAKQRERGEFHKLTDGNIAVNLSGKAIPYLFIYAAFAFLFFTVLLNLFGLEYGGSALTGSLLTILFLINVALTALFVGSFFASKASALITLSFFSYPVFLLSGYSWKLSFMPGFLKSAAYLIPSTPYLNGTAKLLNAGAGFGSALPELQLSAAQLIIFSLITYYRYKSSNKSLNDEV